MAPNKKRRKPAANPARGFATVSVPSKPKGGTPDEDPAGVVDEVNKTHGSDPAPASPHAVVTASIPDTTAPPSNYIREMSPDQLEAHLEDAELQILLEANSARYKSEAARQVLRLRTELRQLRSQSIKLSTYNWLEDSVVDQIISTFPMKRTPKAASATSDPFRNGDHKALLDLWTLQQVLSSLSLPRVADAIAHVLQLECTHPLSSDNGYIWGLTEALDWYALKIPLNLLPHYETSSTPSLSHSQSPSKSNAKSTKEETSSEAPLVQASTITADPSSPIEATDFHEAESQSSDELNQDDDNDPIYLIESYLRLKTQLWKREHRDLHTSELRTRNCAKTQKQRSRLEAIERDILFDKEEALRMWKPIEVRLEAENSMRRKAKKKAEAKDVTTNGERKPAVCGSAADDPASLHDDDEVPDAFGSMFETAEDQLNDDQPQSLASNIRIVDFGTPAGMTPRQLLEQTCRNVDPEFKLKLMVLQQTTYSARHQLQLLWSIPHTPDAHAVQAAPTEITLSLLPRHWSLDMRSIAAANVEQSVAYASTVMLFLVLSLEGQESQVNLRLAGSWRDLLISLFDTRKEVIKIRDKMEVKDLRRMIDQARSEYESQCRNNSDVAQDSWPDANLTVRQRTEGVLPFTPERAWQEWYTRSKSMSFNRMLEIRRALPIHQHKHHILKAIMQSPVSIIQSATGSGKSTQAASFLLEQELSSGRDCRILVTQPRRISAISIARRVSEELGEAPGALGTPRSLVGYSIRLESKTSLTTRLTFATTGVLLRMLESSPMLEQLNYLILDEVHERTLETDLLFIALRELLKKRDDLHVVLMSATVDVKLFSDYFGGAPVLDIPGRTFPVEVLYLEDAIEATNDVSEGDGASSASPDEEETDDDDRPSKDPRKSSAELEGYSSKTRRRLTEMDEYRIDYGLVVKLAVAIATKKKYAKYSAAILIFMPGISEIRRMYHALMSTDSFNQGWNLHMLHSSFSTEELERAFAIPPPGERKIVIATNIAETGITIPDVTAVIDTCKEKVMRYNERRQLSKLTEGFISRSSARQRRGRAARVQDGLCFHLVTKQHYDNGLQEQATPEILRLSLQDPILRIKIWKFGSIEKTLEAAISPPPKKNVVRAIDKLREAGALTGSEYLTALGEQVARLPLDIALAKLAIYGAIFRCVDPILAVISLLTSKSPFLGGVNASFRFSRAESDLLTLLNAYEAWKKAKLSGSAIEFCRKNFLSDQALLRIEEQKVQLLVYLVDGGQVVLSRDERIELNQARVTNLYRRDFYEIPQRYNQKVSDDLLLSLISMALYPRILMSLAMGSVNEGSSKSLRWVSFLEAVQAKSSALNVFQTSRIPEVALSLLLGEGDVKMFAGVLSIDSGRIRLALGNWKQALALKTLRKALTKVLDRCHRRPGEPLPEKDQQWLQLFMDMTAVKEVRLV